MLSNNAFAESLQGRIFGHWDTWISFFGIRNLRGAPMCERLIDTATAGSLRVRVLSERPHLLMDLFSAPEEGLLLDLHGFLPVSRSQIRLSHARGARSTSYQALA